MACQSAVYGTPVSARGKNKAPRVSCHSKYNIDTQKCTFFLSRFAHQNLNQNSLPSCFHMCCCGLHLVYTLPCSSYSMTGTRSTLRTRCKSWLPLLCRLLRATGVEPDAGKKSKMRRVPAKDHLNACLGGAVAVIEHTQPVQQNLSRVLVARVH